MTMFSNSQLRLGKPSANSFTESKWYAHQQCMAVFTTAAIDNIEHNPCSTRAKETFHGIGISLLQHPSFSGEGVDRNTVFVEGSVDASSQNIGHLPHYYIDVPPFTTSIKHSTVLATTLTSLDKENFKKQTAEDFLCLDNAKKVLMNNTLTSGNASWEAFHASRQPQEGRVIFPTVLLLLFLDSAHTVAMFRHSIDVVTKAVNHLNPGQIPVVTFDLSLFALDKQIQWTWPESYGENKLVIMLGGLHIEMAALKILGDWLHDCGWENSLVQAQITMPGTADSFLRAAHIGCTRRAHHVTAAALYILQHWLMTATVEEKLMMQKINFSLKIGATRDNIFLRFSTGQLLELEVLVLVYVHSMRQSLIL